MSRNGQIEGSSRQEFNIEVISRCACINWPSFSIPLASNYFYLNSFPLEHLNFITRELLVSRFSHLVLRLQIYPQLEAQRVFLGRGRDLRVENPSSSSHPLEIPWSNLASMAFEILMEKASLEHVSDRFETTVRVVWESSW